MKIKTNELIGSALDWAVAKSQLPQGWPDAEILLGDGTDYSTDWSLAGPIIEREFIYLIPAQDGDGWFAHPVGSLVSDYYGLTPLVAAMKASVALRLGTEVDVPDELMESK